MFAELFLIKNEVWEMVLSNLFFLNIVLSIVIIFFQRRDPQAVWTWLLVLYFVPFLGFFLYLVIGQDLHKNRMFRTKEIEDELNSAIRKQEDIILRKKFEMKDAELSEFTDLVLYNLESSGAVYTDDNNVTIYTDGREKFDALLDEIAKAKEHIHIQYYIMRRDELFGSICDALVKKVEEGVEVRILYDSLGCRDIRGKDWRYLRSKGIRTAEFFPAALKKLHLRLNYRNHRKIVVVDGRVGFVGGFNIGNEYLGMAKKFGYWRDTHMKIEGSAVSALQLRFMMDWNYASKENLLKNEAYFKVTRPAERENTGIQIITSGPDSKRQNIRNNYLKLINKAKNNIYIQTPYFIPDGAIFDSIKIAALSGVDVKIMIPCKPDHPFVYWATYSYIGDLLDAGVKCYTYDNGFLHSKGITVDGMVSCYGTANMDIRSFKLNFEVNAVIYDSKTTKEFESIFLKDLRKCTQITPYVYGQRSLVIRFKEQFSRLLSPLM